MRTTASFFTVPYDCKTWSSFEKKKKRRKKREGRREKADMRLCHGWWWRAARLLIPRISMRVEYRSVSIHDRATWKPSLVSSAPVIRFASSCACFLPDNLSRFNCCSKGGIYRFPSGSMESSFLFFISFIDTFNIRSFQ